MTWLIEEMLKKFEHSPDIGKLLVTNLEVLLQADMRTEAKEFMEYVITGNTCIWKMSGKFEHSLNVVEIYVI